MTSSSTIEVAVSQWPRLDEPLICTSGSTTATSPASWQAAAYRPSACAFARTATAEGMPGAMRSDRPPAGELGPELGVGAQPGQQPVQALGDRLAPGARQRPSPRIHPDPGHHAQRMQGDGKRPAQARVLAQRLVAQDHAADALGEPGGGDQQLPVGPRCSGVAATPAAVSRAEAVATLSAVSRMPLPGATRAAEADATSLIPAASL